MAIGNCNKNILLEFSLSPTTQFFIFLLNLTKSIKSNLNSLFFNNNSQSKFFLEITSILGDPKVRVHN